MQKRSGLVIFSPSDLNRFFESPFASWMDRLHLEQPGELTPDAKDEEAQLLADTGMAHERRHLATLRAAGKDVWEPPTDFKSFEAKHQATVAAMRDGRGVIYQGALRHESFEGYSDFLYRVESPSALGAFRYEVVDTKLARKAQPYFLLQLCAYAKMLEAVQGVRPENVHIVNGDGDLLSFRTDDYYFYFASLERDFLETHRAFEPESQPTPEPRTDHGRWASHAAQILEDADHLCRVAGITSHQMRRLVEAGIGTLTALAQSAVQRVPKMDDAVLRRLQRQAFLQLESRGRTAPLYELVPPDADRPRGGLALLPPVSPMDVYFDMEGYPLAEGGLEYLFGATHLDKGDRKFTDFWGHDRAGEKAALERFIDWVYARFQDDPSMHVFHYANYEDGALRRLTGSHATRESELDVLLRAEVFVDLHRVVRQSVRVGEPSYSLKSIEHLYRLARSGDVATASESIVEYARWLERPDGDSWETSPILAGIRDYNRQDCESTLELRLWLAERRVEAQIAYIPPTKKEEGKEKKVDAVRDAADALARRLIDSVPVDASEDPERWRIHALLSHLVGFHRRDARPGWRVVYERQKQTHEDLVEDIDCLGACVRTAAPKIAVKRSFAYEYRFDPDQDTKLHEGSDCYVADSLSNAEIFKLHADAGLVEVKLARERDEPANVISLIPNDFVGAEAIEASIARVAESWERTGKLAPALDTFLRRAAPRVRSVEPGASLLGGAEANEVSVTALIAGLDQSAVAVQGPPGAGKTRVASAAIAELAACGHRIGVASNSHKAINKLIEEVQKRAVARRAALRVTKINSDPEDELIAQGSVTGKKSMKDVDFGGAESPQIVGGTAWAFSHPSAVNQFDYLFVDEAGQVSLANLVGMSPCAKNLVLLGDQMQLGQPIQGSHPGESGQSALEYLLQDHRAIPEHLGVFLATTWRMHPDLCRFISGAVYEDKLHAEPGTRARTVKRPDGTSRKVAKESGILFVPVPHEGNAQASAEEAAEIARLLDELRSCEFTGSQGDGPRKLTNRDVLIVAPYNMQVRALRAGLGAGVGPFEIGSVDKFQGQEAAVVIVSMCSSSGDSSPRGLEFLLDANRLNVALSRAQSLAIVVGSPLLARTRVASVAQMKLVNLFCRIVEEGR
jgi:predicted RecB family nuclease